MKHIIYVLLFIFLTAESNAEDKSITICSFEWPPHHGRQLKNEGYTAEIIKEIFEPQGYKIKKLFLPWKRAQMLSKEGKQCDAITELYYNEERSKWYWFGSPYSLHEIYLFTLRSNPLKDYTSLSDLKKYIIGYNRGGSLSKEFDSADYLTKVETEGYSVGFKMLLKKRIDFFASSKSVALYEIQKMQKKDKIHYIGRPLNKQFVFMAFSRKNPNNLQKLLDYNNGLFLLFKSGKYNKILKKHGIII